MKAIKFNTPWIMAVALATCCASTNVLAQSTTDSLHGPATPAPAVELSDADAQNLVRRSVQYDALYDTLMNFVFNKKIPSPAATGTRPITPQA